MDNEIVQREMTTTQPDFRRWLAFAFPQGVREHEGVLRVTEVGAAMEITLMPLPPRVIAALRLPRVAVRIRFTDGTPQQWQDMLARLDRALQRGGG